MCSCSFRDYWKRFLCLVIAIRDLIRNYDSDGNENVKKAVAFISRTTTLHVNHLFSVNLFAVSAQLRLEMTKF